MYISRRFLQWTSYLSCSVLLFWGSTAYAAFGDVVLKYGMQGDDIVTLQNKLRALGYSIDNVDGNFGNNTLQAVMAFQADNGMKADGVVGAETVRGINGGKPAPIMYTVQSGDSLMSIAQCYNLFPADVARMNHINNPAQLRVGQVLRLPTGTSVNRSIMASNLRSKGARVVAMAQRFKHVPYVWGGTSSNGFDCSGFIYYLYAKQGIFLPRSADAQFQVGQRIAVRDLQQGDLVFFETYEVGPSHVGIYIGGGQFIHASSGAGEVTITPLNKPYYAAHYLGARRVI